MCSFFLQGRCGYGNACRFEHPKQEESPAPEEPQLAPPPPPPPFAAPVAQNGGYAAAPWTEDSPWPDSAAAGRPFGPCTGFSGFPQGLCVPAQQEVPKDILKCWATDGASEPPVGKAPPAQLQRPPGPPPAMMQVQIVPLGMVPMQQMQPMQMMQMMPPPHNMQQQHQEEPTMIPQQGGQQPMMPPRPRQQQPEKPQWDAFELEDAECGICFDSIRRKGERFGMLESCDHAFCLSCIRSWRKQREQQDKVNLRLCPICRNESFFVIPSDTLLLDPKVKGEAVSKYKDEMRRIPCKLFDYARGSCAFGSSCFYAHLNPDGTRYIPPRPRWMAGADGSLVKKDVNLSDFFA